jgi:hypothetical protein
MKRVVLVIALASVGVTAAAAASAGRISQTSIAGARLGLHANAYKGLFGKPVRMDVLRYPSGYTRLVFTKRKVAVIFPPSRKASEIISWNTLDETAKRIGTCSSITGLKHAYGSELKVVESATPNGKVFAYHVGKLIFAATGRTPSKHVTSIALYSGAQNIAWFLAGQLETSALHCS